MFTVIKDFNTTTRRFRRGAILDLADLIDVDLQPFRDGGFIAAVEPPQRGADAAVEPPQRGMKRRWRRE